MCIRAALHCDGVPHCADGSDEGLSAGCELSTIAIGGYLYHVVSNTYTMPWVAAADTVVKKPVIFKILCAFN
jgi:hypothetical protein